jgi:alkylhydroperoxidase family enzyme
LPNEETPGIFNLQGACVTEKNAILDMQWPDPLVSPQTIMARTPWMKPPMMSRLAYAPPRLIDIATLVTTQENACRFCYGAIHTMMRLSGYSEKRITDLERDVQLADGLTREVVSLSRKLSRSNPRPVKQELEALQRLGLDPKAVAEIVFLVAFACYATRIGTFLSLPPDLRTEKSIENPITRLIGSVVFRFSPMRSRRVGPTPPVSSNGLLGTLLRALPDAPVASWFAAQLEVTFAAPAIPRRTKLLMLAVIARTLGCPFCEGSARADLEALGLGTLESARALESLSGPGVTASDAILLDWARDTVRYETGPMQKRMRQLATEVSTDVLLEAVATAAISNTAVRLAMLIQ